jgi:hypothetical protein
MDCLPAKQSSISAFSAGTSKMPRLFAHFLRPESTGEALIRLSTADLCSILSVENLDGALPVLLPKRASPGYRLSATPNSAKVRVEEQDGTARDVMM